MQNALLPASLPSPTSTVAVSERGSATRDRLLNAAAPIFAAKGYRAASTREICLAAGVNAASIHYHFGDKAGLYREVLVAPVRGMAANATHFNQPGLSFEQSMQILYAGLLAPLRSADPRTAQIVRLHYREFVEPSGVLGDLIPRTFAPHYQATLALVCRALALANPDEDAQRLIFCLLGMAFDFYSSTECVEAYAPGLLASPAAIDTLVERLVSYAGAIVAAERTRRGIRTK